MNEERIRNVKKWAEFVRSHDISEWKPQQKNLIDSQIIMGNRFYDKLCRTKDGKKKVRKLILKEF